MPKEKPPKVSIKAFYKSQAEDIFMFGFIYGVQKYLPAFTTRRLIEDFKKELGYSEDDYPTDCASTNYTVMKKRFFDLGRTEIEP